MAPAGPFEAKRTALVVQLLLGDPGWSAASVHSYPEAEAPFAGGHFTPSKIVQVLGTRPESS
jgi:hypothetical protein